MRHRSVLAVFAALMALATTAIGRIGPVSAGTLTSSSSCNGKWQPQQTPMLPSSAFPGLNSVSAISMSNAWAVGDQQNSKHVYRTLVEHWNGQKWSLVTAPNVGTKNTWLESVAARTTKDVWAVGYSTGTSTSKTLIEHWNGSKWTVVPSPNVDGNGELFGVVTLSASDVWAVGNYGAKNVGNQTLAVHWDGSAWHVVDTPQVPNTTNDGLSAVSASGPGDVWAVGDYVDSGGRQATMSEHYDGGSWTVVPTQDPSPPDTLAAVAQFGPNDVWAVGVGNGGGTVDAPVAEHYAGSWSSQPPPSPNGGARLFGVAGSGSNDVWAVGGASLFSHTKAIIDHWDGAKWASVAPPKGAHDLQGVDLVSAGHGFAVGSGFAQQVTVLRLC